MMLGGSSSLIGNNSAAGEAQESGGDGEVGGGAGGAIPSGGGGGGFSDEDKGNRIEGGGGGIRWPRQETLALLQIRSEMGVIFRDSNLKGPLWEEVSRKMAQLGYQRSAKKCKEKFENVYKYHKRTKDSRAAKADGKSYRFFEQLEALESSPSPISSLPPPPPRLLPPPPLPPPPPAPPQVSTNTLRPTAVTVTSAAIPVSFSPSVNNPMWSQSQLHSLYPQSEPQKENTLVESSHPHLSSSLMMSDSMSSSSSTSSDIDIERRHKKKRKLRDFFDRLMKDVIAKQEELQTKFLETLEKRERDRMVREEAWRVQEMARMNRELDLLAQERSKAAAKDAAMMTFLQKMTGQQSPQTPLATSNVIVSPHHQVQVSQHPLPFSQPLIPLSLPSTATPLPPLAPPTLAAVATKMVDTPPATTNAITTVSIPKNDNVGENFMTPSSSRWPKAEVEALIGLRTNVDVKYLDNNPKGPLWEEISIGMRKMGYNRSAKRCKEKWENINKYFKKVKESNKKRPEDSKTCPYFQQLDAIYREKAKTDPSSYSTASAAYVNTEKSRSDNPMLPLMIRPEQQWPLLRQEPAAVVEDHESDNMDEDDGDEEDDEDDGQGYEIVTNKQAATSMSVATSAAE